MIDLTANYPGRTDVSDPTGYPGGAYQNEVTPGVSNDGTPVEKAEKDDLRGALLAILALDGASPNGAVEKVGASQVANALLAKFTATDDNRLLTADEAAGVGASTTPITGANPAVSQADIAGIANALSTANLLYIEDQQASGTNGGTSTGAVWNTRVLNTQVVSNISGASLSVNQITLPAGTYWIEFDAPARVGAVSTLVHKARLRNITDATTPIAGSSEENGANVSDQAVTRSFGAGLLTIGAAKVFELQHYVSVGFANQGFGTAVTSGENEIYARIKIWKVA